MSEPLTIRKAKPGDVLRDADGDVWFIREDGCVVGVFEAGAIVYAPADREGFDDLHGPFVRVPVGHAPRTAGATPPPSTTTPCHLVNDDGIIRVVTRVTRPMTTIRVTDGGFFEMVRVEPTDAGDDE